MEVKLNPFTLSLLCSGVSVATLVLHRLATNYTSNRHRAHNFVTSLDLSGVTKDCSNSSGNWVELGPDGLAGEVVGLQLSTLEDDQGMSRSPKVRDEEGLMDEAEDGELGGLIRAYLSSLKDLKESQGTVARLRDELEEARYEVGALRLVTDRSEQTRRMSILMDENQFLQHTNNYLQRKLREVEEAEAEDSDGDGLEGRVGPTMDAEVLKLKRTNDELMAALKAVRLQELDLFKKFKQEEREKVKALDKVLEVTDLLTTAEEELKVTASLLADTDLALKKVKEDDSRKAEKLKQLLLALDEATVAQNQQQFQQQRQGLVQTSSFRALDGL